MFKMGCAACGPEWWVGNPRACTCPDKQEPKREWVGLTNEEINKLRYKKDWTAPWTDMTFARAIEAKLKEKNSGA